MNTTPQLIAFAVIALAGATTAYAQPRLQMQAVHDWGKVVPMNPDEQKVRARIPLKNIGDQPLKITQVRPSCGCTSAPLEKDSLEPGEETFLNITLNLPSANGALSTKYVTVYTNEPQKHAHDLALKVDVERPLQISSSYIPFNAGTVNTPITGKITFTVASKLPVTISADSLPAGIAVTTPLPVIVRTGESVDILLTYTTAETGPIQREVSFHTDLPGYETITLRAVGMVDAAAPR